MSTLSSEENIAEFGCSRIHYRIAGHSSALPDFVLDHGGGGSADDWISVAPLLAAHARVLSYDRAGMGQSPADALGCDAPAVSQRLAQVVEHAGVRKPFILVGYSLGGLYARYHAQMHSQDLAGLVLVDATPTTMEIPPDYHRKLIRLLKRFHWLARSGLGPLYLWIKGQRIDAGKARRGLVRFAAPDFVECMAAEFAAIPRIQAEVERVAAQPLHPTLMVLADTAPGRMPPAEFSRLRQMQDSLAQSAPGPLSRQVVVEGAHHGNLVSDPGNAAQLADHILAFARSLEPRRAA